MKFILVIIGLSFSLIANCQNLIPNGDFENYNALPFDKAEWYNCKYWTNLNGYEGFAFGYGSPDYFHDNGFGIVDLPVTAFSLVYAYSGKAIWVLLPKQLVPQILESTYQLN